MKNLIVANWKMNPESANKAKEIFDAVKNGVGKTNSEVVICPPYVYLPLLSGLILGAQSVFYQEKGAFTGEVSPLMLKNLNVEYAIIGHSEARKYLNETDEIINKKIKTALLDGLKVIFCIGETEAQRDAGKKNEVIERQIKIGLSGVDNFENLNIAYEPVWAIGTGNNCSVKETAESITFIRNIIKSDLVRIIYGGSVKSENSESYIKDSGASGLLVGGASLNPEEFLKIIKSAE